MRKHLGHPRFAIHTFQKGIPRPLAPFHRLPKERSGHIAQKLVRDAQTRQRLHLLLLFEMFCDHFYDIGRQVKQSKWDSSLINKGRSA